MSAPVALVLSAPPTPNAPELHAPAADAPQFITPDYWDDACKLLGRRDAVLKRLIKQHGTGRLKSRGDAFATLARSIIGQQISVKAADALWAAFVAQVCLGDVKPDVVLMQPLAVLRSAGLSQRKAEYVLDLALRFVSNALHPTSWHTMDDAAVIEELTSVRGIGRWTAQMFMIFYLLRPNVFPLDDLSLLKGLSVHYAGGDPISRNQAREFSELWSPWATVGTWYIWRSLDPISAPVPVE